LKYILFLLLLASITVSVSAQNKIPPRIKYKLEAENPVSDIISIIPEILNARINNFHTVIPVAEGMRKHYSIIIKVTNSSFYYILEDSEGLLDTLEYPVENSTSLKSIELMCRSAADAWKGYMGLTDPFVEAVAAEKKRDLSAGAVFEESLSTPYQLSLWLTPIRTAVEMKTSETLFGIFFPLIVDFDWFIKDRWGLNFSFFGDVSSYMSFADFDLGEGDYRSGESFNIAMLPGFGVTFRSLGRVSGSYGFNFYWGMVRISALEDLSSDSHSSSYFLLTGDSKWVAFPLLSLKSGVSWNIDKSWSVRSRMVMFLSPIAFIHDEKPLGYFPGTGASLSVIVQLGAGYRW